MSTRKLSIILIVFIWLFSANSVLAVPAYQNYLSKSDWAKYGVNPWRIDTDYDGYSDQWEVQNGFCPTNYKMGVMFDEYDCEPGKFNLKTGKYTLPTILRNVPPAAIKKFPSCLAIDNMVGFSDERWRDEKLYSSSTSSSVSIDINRILNQDVKKVQTDVIKDAIVRNGKTTAILHAGAIQVISGSGVKAKEIAQVKLVGISQVKRFYLSGNKLVVVGKTDESDWGWNRVLIWEVGTNNLKLWRQWYLSGEIFDAQIRDNYLYLVGKQFYLPDITADRSTARVDHNSFIPFYRLGNTTKNKLAAKSMLACNQLEYIDNYLPSAYSGYSYAIAVSLANAKTPILTKTIAGIYNRPVLSGKNLYWLSWVNKGSVNEPNIRTDIYKFALQKGKFNYIGSHFAPGIVQSADMIKESNDNFLWVATYGPSQSNTSSFNRLYLYSADMNLSGWYLDFGAESRATMLKVNSTRLYLATASTAENEGSNKQFVFDITKPREPYYIGIFDYPGYVQKVYDFGDQFIGFGQNSLSGATTSGFLANDGLKLGWFEVNDYGAFSELGKKDIGESGSYSLAQKSQYLIGFDATKKIVVVPVMSKSKMALSTSTKTVFNGFFVYELDRVSGFKLRGGVDYGVTGLVSSVGPIRIFGEELWIVTYGEVAKKISGKMKMVEEQRLRIYRLKGLSLIKEVKL